MPRKERISLGGQLAFANHENKECDLYLLHPKLSGILMNSANELNYNLYFIYYFGDTLSEDI